MDKIRIGVFGAWRGSSYISLINGMEEYRLVAICDRRAEETDSLKNSLGEDVQFFTDFDEFIETPMDAVVLANFFNEHAPYAIRALEKGIAVLSECTAASTMKECVELVRAVERTGGTYMLAENYPFTVANLELARLTREGTFGKILYCEGEYDHGCPEDTLRELTPGKYHWRAWMPRTYYVTHALGPLLYMTDSMPKVVNARAVHSPALEKYDSFRHNYDAAAMMFCETDTGALLRFTGCAAMASDSGYRVVGEFGSAETGRALGGAVRLLYNSWTTPEGRESCSTYAPEPDEVSQKAAGAGHGGGDYWVLYNFMRTLLYGDKPFFDVYRSAAMSAVGILAWRSCLNEGKPYFIPDFRNEDERKQWENDDLTPFPDQNGNGVTLPCSSMAAKRSGFKVD